MAGRFRPRKEFKFWLYRDIEMEARLIDYIHYLRKTRQFARTVRNGLRLMWTLGEGDLSVLFELFPGLQSRLTPKNDELIERFRQMLQAQPVAAVPIIPALTTGTTLTAPKLLAPTFDDDDDQDTLLIRRDTTADGQAASNFLDSVLSLQ